MISCIKYDSKQRKREYFEIDDLETLIIQFESLPDYSGTTLELKKNTIKLKFQVTYDDYYRITFYVEEHDKSILEKKEFGLKCITLFFEDDEKFKDLAENPLEYFKKDKKVTRSEIFNDQISTTVISATKKKLINTQIYKTYKGKKYTKEEWEKLEQKLFETYAQKNNLRTAIDIEKEKRKKEGGFFLGEKEVKD